MTHLVANYARFDVDFDYGKGCFLYNQQQRPYLDFASGIAVSSLGHAHPAVTEVLHQQADRLWHTSNLYRIPQQEVLAELLCQYSFADKVLFSNSGLEANEAALKLVRRYFNHIGKPEKNRYLVIDGAFHGRSLALIGASPHGKMTEGYAPLPDWFDIAPTDDLQAVAKTIHANTAAIVLEPLQGDGGGIHLFSTEYLRGLRHLCDEHDLLLVFDEIQCGNGRTGKLWCHQHSSITPDIMTTAKGLGAGFPIGAMLATAKVAEAMNAGSHGSTFAGNPLAMAVGIAVMHTITADGFLDHVQAMGDTLQQALQRIVEKFPKKVTEVLGLGLMRGLRCHDQISHVAFTQALLQAGLLVVPAGRNVIRLLPPLIVSAQEIDQAEHLLHHALTNFSIHKSN